MRRGPNLIERFEEHCREAFAAAARAHGYRLIAQGHLWLARAAASLPASGSAPGNWSMQVHRQVATAKSYLRMARLERVASRHETGRVFA